MAYRASRRTSTQATPFLLVYKTETIVPIEVTVSFARVTLTSKLVDCIDQSCVVESFEERRKMQEGMLCYQK